MARDRGVQARRRRRRWSLLVLLAAGIATATMVQGVGIDAVAELIPADMVRDHAVPIVAGIFVVSLVLVGLTMQRIEGDQPRAASTTSSLASLAPAPCPPSTHPHRGGLHNLGPRNLAFTGRVDLLRHLDQLLARSRPLTWIALHGLGGVGKTELAREVGHRLAARYEIVWFIPAHQPAAIRAALRELADRLGLVVGRDWASTITALVDELDRRGRWLLVFDATSGPADLLPLLPTNGSGQVLITSRNPAWGANALAVHVPCLAPADARAFLLAGSRSDDTSAADELAEALGRLPLALAQAVAYINQHPGVTLRGYLARYGDRQRRLLEDEDSQPLGYPHTVATTWELALQELGERMPAAVQLLRLAAFLAPDARIPVGLLQAAPELLPPALRAAVGDWVTLDRVTGALQRHGLIASDEDGFQVHRLVQVITRDHLLPRQWRAWASRATDLLVASLPEDPGNPEQWRHVHELLPHVLAVISHTEDPGQHPDLLRVLGVYLGSMNRSRDELWEAHRHLSRARDLTEQRDGRDHPAVAHILSNLGAVLCELGDPAAAEQELNRALAILSSTGGSSDPLQTGGILNNLGLVRAHQGDLDGAQQALEQAVKLLEVAFGPERLEVAAPLVSLGSVLSELGQHTRARELLERAFHIEEDAYEAENLELARTRVVLGRVLHRQGDLVGAGNHLHRALTSFELTYGPRHPQVSPIARELGAVLMKRGRLWSGFQRSRQGRNRPRPEVRVRHPDVGGPSSRRGGRATTR